MEPASSQYRQTTYFCEHPCDRHASVGPHRATGDRPSRSSDSPSRETSRFGRGKLLSMSDVTHILSAIEQGDPSAAEQLLPLVYDELRKLAAHWLAAEKPGQTLEATALVHEAYLRLVDVEQAQHWNRPGHFFAAAAEALR